jgi:hypothetical protein
MAEGIFTSVSDFIRERRPEAKMLRGEIAAAGLRPVQMSAEQIRAMGYADPNAFREARLASGQMVDAELEIAVRNRMGPVGASSIDASRYKTLFTTPKNLSGTYYPPNYPQEDRRVYEAARGLDKVFQELGMEGGESDMVYALSAINANPRLLAHEFGHRSGGSERQVQLMDAWRARTPEEWRDSVRRWKDYDELYRGIEPDSDQSYSEAEAALLEQLQNKRETLLDLEADAMEQQRLRTLATFEERGLPYTPDTPERLAELRARNLENLGNSADSRAALRRPSTRRAYGGGIHG